MPHLFLPEETIIKALAHSSPAPCPLSGQEHGVGRKVSASPAPQGPRDGVPTILVRLVGRGLRRLLERPRDVEGGVGGWVGEN